MRYHAVRFLKTGNHLCITRELTPTPSERHLNPGGSLKVSATISTESDRGGTEVEVGVVDVGL